ncbi:MAG: oxidoreductase [Candidatus Marinimicrobia bacterium]|nr:oxidoreductase [Candidatus Neomarinimicrobiota bacterium]|tara:strand:+ start:70049 stop:71068 length:1020 start_codon:yes stop_codon:yes gene_type:complete
MKLRAGIIGYGVVGKKRREVIDANDDLQTICVSDLNFKSNGIFSDGVKYYNNYNNVFEQDLDVVFVSLPNYLAAKVTILGLENNCHVFCEKPPSRTVEELQEVIKCSDNNPNLKLKYGFNHRYHDSVKKANEIIESEQLGEVVSIRGVYGKSSIIPFGSGWRSEKKYSGGGILIDQGIHMLDLVRYFSTDYEEIHSVVTNDYWGHDVEDNAFVLMRNKKGQVALLHSTATQWQHRFRIEIILSEGLIELTGILTGSKSYGSETLKIIKRKKGDSSGAQKEKVYTFLEDNSWQDEINEFSECIKNNTPILNGTSHDALKVMEMIMNIYKSDKYWWKIFNQ